MRKLTLWQGALLGTSDLTTFERIFFKLPERLRDVLGLDAAQCLRVTDWSPLTLLLDWNVSSLLTQRL